jgi:peptidyl-prolyl cis-trans isomerase C
VKCGRSFTIGRVAWAIVLCASALPACKANSSQYSSKSSKNNQPSAGVPLPGQTLKELDLPLATVGDVVITLGDFQERLNRQSPYIRNRYTSIEQKKEFLENLIRFEVLAKEAERRGFDKDPEVVRTMKQVMIQKLIAEEFDQKLTAAAITDEELQKYYNANIGEYVQPEEVRASAIIMKNRAQADRVLLEAQGEAGKTNKGFRDLVGKYTQDEDSKLRGGDLRYFAIDSKDVPKPVVDAGFALAQTGDVSGVIVVGDGSFYILKQTGRKKSMTRTFDDAKGMIRNKLFRDKRVALQDKFLAELRSKSKIVIDEASLAKVKIESSSGGIDDGRGKSPQPTPEPNLPPGMAPGNPSNPDPTP